MDCDMDIDLDLRTQTYRTMNEWNKKDNNNKKLLNLIHINIKTIRKYWDTLKILLTEIKYNVDILIVTEINIKDEDEMDLYNIQGYDKTFECRENRTGGGICVYYKQKYSTKKIQTNFTQSENLCISVQNDDKTIDLILHTIYRPPSNNKRIFLEELETWTYETQAEHRDIILVGDINIDISELRMNNDRTRYLDILMSYGLKPMIWEITREELVLDRLDKSCIDHINIRTNKKTKSSVIQEKPADHYFVALVLYGNQINRNKKTFTMIDHEKVNELIRIHDWEKIMKDSENSNDLYENIRSKILEFYKLGEKTITIKEKYEQNKWITQGIRDLIKTKNSLWKIIKRYPQNQIKRREYKTVRNKLTTNIRKERKKHISQEVNRANGDMKKMWKIINTITEKKIPKSNDEIIRSNFKNTNQTPTEIADNFNSFFYQFHKNA